MKRTNLQVLTIALLLSNPALVAEKTIKPITKKTLRLEGESKQDMFNRLIWNHEQLDTTAQNIHAKLADKKTGKPHKVKYGKKERKYFKKNFEGYWQLDTITIFSAFTLIEFFEDACGKPMATFYDGTQNDVRERNANDAATEQLIASTVGQTIPVEILGSHSLRFLNTGEIISSDGLTSTFRIQDNDRDVAYSLIWLPVGAAGDSPEYGITETLSRFRRLPERPYIQQNNLPSKVDWTNPVEIVKYMFDYYALLSEPQKSDMLNQHDWIGWPKYQEALQRMLTTGVTRTAQVSTAFRGDGYIGVWRTQFPEDFPLTTISTEEVHHFNPGSTIKISGFKGAYEELNGTRLAAAFPPFSLTKSTPFPWQDNSSRQPYIHIVYDSSHIEEAYNPSIHGVATLEAVHGPITPDSTYREFVAGSIDLFSEAFGSGTHTRLLVWQDSPYTIPETFQELRQGIANNALGLTVIRFRDYGANSVALYWNPVVLSFGLAFPPFNLNDPFGLGTANSDPNFDYDITLENYLDKSTVKNILFTVTGPELNDEPITSMLTEMGYTSNGSQVVFTTANFGEVPAPLVDEFGSHAWMRYGSAVNANNPISLLSYFGGLVNKDITGDSTVVYIRIADFSPFDTPLGLLQGNSLVFGRDDITAKYGSNAVAAWAALLESLNQYSPDKYIIDIRNNGGGIFIANAIASLFGGNREGITVTKALVAPGNGYAEPTIVPGSDIQTVFDSIAKGPRIINTDEAAAAFPQAIVRGNEEQPKEVIILTSTQAASAADFFPHVFLGPDSEGMVQDLGQHVTARIVGDIDGRLWGTPLGYGPPPVDPLSPNLEAPNGDPRTATYMMGEGGSLLSDRHGFIVNETLAIRPNPLIAAWYDQTEWQDIGVTKNLVPYPLPANGNGETTPIFDFNRKDTWRDIWLETAIAK